MERKYIAVKNFCVHDLDGNIKVIPQDAVITLEPDEKSENLPTKVTVNIPDSMCVYSFYISAAIIDPVFPLCVKDYDGKSKSPEELKLMEHEKLKSEGLGKPSANRHAQIKICRTLEEANRFMANCPDTDIVSVTPLVMGTSYYADTFFQVVYRANL